ncbi:MAG: phosphatase PAP2 family protein [Burkholderiaceae bacterium]|nr:phosphatase PAP2 family protein [Burkholderiaceae bacterium]
MTRSDALNDDPLRRRWCVLLVVSLLAFVAIAFDVGTGPLLVSLDQHASQRLLARDSGEWTSAMQWLARVHGVAGIAVVGTMWSVWLLCRGETMQLARLALIVGGGLALNGVLKQMFQRHRPVFGEGGDMPLHTLSSYSFPSGHVSGSVVFYGFVLMVIFARTAHRGRRFAAGGVACAMVTLMAYNRVYIGAHFVSDVLAALAEGLAWLAFCALLLQRVRPQPSV